MALATFAALAAATALLGYVWFHLAFRERLALAHKLPGPTVYPVIGNLYLIWTAVYGDFAVFFQECWKRSKEYPEKVVRILWMHRVAVALWNPDDVEVILSSSSHLQKANEYSFFKPWLGDGLLISNGETWRTHRRLIAPTFHVNVLKQFVHLFNRNSRALCDKLAATAGRTIDAHDYMSETTVEVLLETAMGVDRSTQKRGFDYAVAVMDMCGILHRRPFRPWLWPDLLFERTADGQRQEKLLDTIHGLTREVLAKRKQERQAGVRAGLYKRIAATDAEEHTAGTGTGTGSVSSTTENVGMSFGQSAGLRDDLDDDIGEKKRIAFLDQMLDAAEDGVVLSDQEVEDEVNTIMFEGHDTTAAASSFFLTLMGLHRDAQERCVAELREIFGDSDRPVTFRDTLEMKYLERCLMETLRLYPPVPIVARHLNENVKLKSGYVVPEGSTVVVTPFLLHRDPDTYPNPSVFNPDNFLPERCVNRHYYAFVPFSAGPRSCVGRKYAMLKLKILLSTILRKFEVRSEVPESEFQLIGDIILKRKEGFPVQLLPRGKAATPIAAK